MGHQIESDNQTAKLRAVVRHNVQYCLFCGFTPYLANRHLDTVIDWNDAEKHFEVRVAGNREFIHQGIVDYLIIFVADESRCSCGATLRLEDYSVRTSGDDLKFVGKYACSECKTRQHTILRGIGKALLQAWHKSKRMSLGPNGFELVKEPSDPEDDSPRPE